MEKVFFIDLVNFRINLTDMIAKSNYEQVILTRRGCPVARLSGLTDSDKRSLKSMFIKEKNN